MQRFSQHVTLKGESRKHFHLETKITLVIITIGDMVLCLLYLLYLVELNHINGFPYH